MATDTARRVYTRAGLAYFVATQSTAVLACAWLVSDPFGWMPAMDYLSLRGVLFLMAAALGVLIAYGSMMLLFAAVALALEKLGVKLTRLA